MLVLDGLDKIPWRQLQHAYGAAEDVPDLLRALAGSEQESEDALGELFATIWHQGTVYEASSYAVPFLVELAVSPEVKRRGEILSLIGSLAEGTVLSTRQSCMISWRSTFPRGIGANVRN